MKKLLFLLSIAVLFVVSCKKGGTSNGVWVRIENNVGVVLEDVAIGNVDYGDVPAQARTEYKRMLSPIYAGYCEFLFNNQATMAGNGVCGTPLPPEFEDGYYTFTVNGLLTGSFGVTVTKQ